MSKRTNFDEIKNTIETFFRDNSQNNQIVPISLNEASKNDSDKNNVTFFYNGEELNVIDMDRIAKKQYKDLRVIDKSQLTKDDIVNTSDGFIIDKCNKWYFIEFKDCDINGSRDSLKNGIIKKAYGNWYMLLDILYKRVCKKI